MNNFGELLNFMIGQTAQVAADKLKVPPADVARAIESFLVSIQQERRIGDLFDQSAAQPPQTVPATTAPANGQPAPGGQILGRHYRDMTAAEVSERYGVPITTLALWRYQGKGPEWHRRGYRSVIYDRRAVVKWMAGNGYRQVNP